MIKQLFNFTLDNNYTGTTKLVWTLPKSMLTIPSELQEANKYKFNVNGTDYTCTSVSEGDTKYFFTYKPEGSNVSGIEIQYLKNGENLELAMRTSLVEFSVGDIVKLLEEVDEPTPPTPGDDELIDDTYEIKLRSTTTFNRYAIVDTEVTMKKPDNLAANYVADEAVVKVNGVEVGGGGYPEPTGTIEVTENGLVNVKDYADANVNVPTYPEPTGTITITENGTVNVKDYAEAEVNVSVPTPVYNERTLVEGTITSLTYDEDLGGYRWEGTTEDNWNDILPPYYENKGNIKFYLDTNVATCTDSTYFLAGYAGLIDKMYEFGQFTLNYDGEGIISGLFDSSDAESFVGKTVKFTILEEVE